MLILSSTSCHHRVPPRFFEPFLLLLCRLNPNHRIKDIFLQPTSYPFFQIYFHIQLVQYNNQVNSMEQEVDGLNRSSSNLVRDSQLARGPVSDYQPGFQNRIRHVYLQEENVYGRFTAFLLLKDKLKSQVDSSGTTALAHMCSHNSPYIPLYLDTLPHGDPILNKATNLGHTPLDIAGMYCKREYVDLLKEKGAIDEGRVDHWAIQGANIANWSGHVDIKKKELIAWAAFNNLPEVLIKYAEAGAAMNEPDNNGNTPIDLAVLNKGYESVEVLAKLGLRPKEKLIGEMQSPYLHQLFTELDSSPLKKNAQISLKLTFVPLLLLSQFLINHQPNIYFIILSLLAWSYLLVVKPSEDSTQRPTRFFSQLVYREINYASNHKIYVLLMIILILSALDALIALPINTISLCLYFWILLGITITFSINLATILYGIFTNTTPNQMFQSHKNPQLWKKIDYVVHRNILTRVYKNQNIKDLQSNIQAYFSNP